ncbi:MAG: hypothetical protein M1830_009777 [Pleopsidium flavum]|nr:MAG: hypothetical protein M1830_009777 [Pleopsidium flavum]
MAYDIISEIGFGAPFGFVDKGADIEGLIQNLHDGMVYFGLMSRLYPFTSWIKSTWIGQKYLVAKPEHNSGIGVLMRFRDRLLAQRMQDIEEDKTSDRTDLLQTFIDARTDDGKALDIDYIKAEILLVLLAGADTTGTTFQTMLCYIMSSPEVYDRLMIEIDEATRKGLLSPTPQFSEVRDHCPYYIACVRESMRVCPVTPTTLPRVVSEPGMDLYGKFAPAGTEIACNPWQVHRDKTIYGEDANSFRPERWLEDGEKEKMFTKYNLAFGYGSRVCLGKDIALMELYKGPLQFLRKFKPEIVNKNKPGDFVLKGGVGHWENVWITLSERPEVS